MLVVFFFSAIYCRISLSSRDLSRGFSSLKSQILNTCPESRRAGVEGLPAQYWFTNNHLPNHQLPLVRLLPAAGGVAELPIAMNFVRLILGGKKKF